MGINQKLTPQGILQELYNRNDNWETDHQATLKFSEFEKLLKLDLRLTTQHRRCVELWKDLINFGIFYKVNQHNTAIVDLVQVREILKIPEPKHTEKPLVINQSTKVVT